MAERRIPDALDEAVKTMLADPDATPPLDPRLADLLRVAADLRDLPSPAFKARLATALRSAVPPSGGKPLATAEEITARLAELAAGPKLVAHDLRSALDDLPEQTMRFLATLNGCTLGVSRFSTASHWERHPAGDELLHLLEGEAEVTTLTDEGPIRSKLRAGSLFICPQGLWHRVEPRSPLSLLFATPGEGTEHAPADGPLPGDAPRGTTPRPLRAHSVGAVLRGLPELAITPDTTGEEADASVRQLTALDPCTLGVMRYSGETPWERHLDGDELLHVLDGAVDVTVLTDTGPARVRVAAGSVFVCPRGLWHRQLPRPRVTMLFATPSSTTEVSWANDPRGHA
jgi:quercetin dioxygenase-like cupin family protein